jgi:hypothetical protein
MSVRIAIVLLSLLLIVQSAIAKKKKQTLPDVVLNAETVSVIIDPDAGESLTNPTANRNAQENVEKAFTTWGRFRLQMEPETADLIIVVRKATPGGPSIHNSPADNRPVILQPSDGNIRIGGQQGHAPGSQDPGAGIPEDNGPHMGNDTGSSTDSFAVYFGHTENPTDAAPIWRYMAKNALNAPDVTAVAQFRKAIEESEKQQQQNKP